MTSGDGQPFKEDALGGGPWVVRYTKGRPLLWNVTWSAGKVVNSANTASQEFSPRAGRTAINKVQLNGPDNFIEASGTYEAVDDSRVTPKRIKATISSGRLRAFGAEVPLPIAGSGFFDVMYADDAVRVFRSDSSYAVQVRADVLERQLARQ